MARNSNRFALYVLMFNMFIAMTEFHHSHYACLLRTFGVGHTWILIAIPLFTISFSPIAGDLSDKYGRN
jgi:DHA1 family multidrug resistance protein-like MFS transporter